MKKYLLLLPLWILTVAGFNDSTRSDLTFQAEQQHENIPVVAIKNVSIIPMTRNDLVIENATVVIQGNIIQSINGEIPKTAEIIDGAGKWLIPGLMDMHVHIPVDGHFNTSYPTRAAAIFTNTQHIMTPFIANGVTTVFDLNARAGHFGQRNEILRGDVIGPRMALAAMIDGGEGEGRLANAATDGRQAVRMAKAEGYEFIKLYSRLNKETYKAIIDEANKLGMKVIGHIPNAFKGNIEEAFASPVGMIAHAEEFFKQTDGFKNQNPSQLAQVAKQNSTWLCPTLVVIHSAADQGHSLDNLRASSNLQYVHPLLQSKWLTANNYNKQATVESIARLRRMMEFNNQLVRSFKEAGVPVVVGTDAGSSGVIWGFSLHDELELLVKAGLTPSEAIASATRLPAEWLGIDRVTGSIEAGKLADLILLDENPLKDVRNTRKIAGVFVNGRWLDRPGINALLTDLARHNNEVKAKYEWNRKGEY